MILYSVDFEEIERYQALGQWEKSGEILGIIAKKLEIAGADFVLICTNTMHKVVSQIESMVKIPIIHIADATADMLKKQGIRKVGLLGTKYTMTQDFYKQRLIDHGYEILVPKDEDIQKINEIIFTELVVGINKEESRAFFSKIIDQLKREGAEGIILGCTEIGILVKQKDSSLPIFDTTEIHAKKAVEFVLKDSYKHI